MKDFRPISLCTILYKLIAKVIANRYRKVLDACIDPIQSTFLHERLISDNIILGYEMFHTFSRKRSGRKGVMA